MTSIGSRSCGACPGIRRARDRISATVRAGTGPWQTSGSSQYAWTTRGSRLISIGSTDSTGFVGMIVPRIRYFVTARNEVLEPAALAGPDSTRPSEESGWSIACAIATSPPKLWPSTNLGTPGCSAHESSAEFLEVVDHHREAFHVGTTSGRPTVASMVERVHRVSLRNEPVDHVAIAAGVLAEPVCHNHHAAHGTFGHPAPPEQLEFAHAGADAFDRLARRHGRTTTLIEPVRLSAAVRKASCTPSSSNSCVTTPRRSDGHAARISSAAAKSGSPWTCE